MGDTAWKRLTVRPQDRVRILHVEDTELDAWAARDILREVPGAEAEITRADTLAEALELLAVTDFDVVVLDLNLPDSEGLDTLRRVRAERSDLPLVVFSAVDDPEAAVGARRAGAADFLVKPRVTGQLVWRALRGAIDRTSCSDASPAPANPKSVLDGDGSQAERALSLFVHTARNLRPELDAITQLLSVLEHQQDEPSTDGPDLVRRVTRSVKGMEVRLASLLEYNNLREVQTEPGEIDLAVLARQTFAKMEAQDPGREVTLITPTCLLTQGDPALLQVALRHLMENAWRSTAGMSDGCIELGVLGDREPRIYFVRDNGTGFDPHRSQELFRPDLRLDPLGGATRGAGLGLAMVEQVVRRHRGWIRAESPAGVGATFYFTLREDPPVGAGRLGSTTRRMAG